MVRRKDGLWQEAVTINGKRKYFYGKTKAEVLRKFKAYEEKASGSPDFSLVADMWWDEAEPLLAHGTTTSYKPALVRAKERMKGLSTDDITPDMVFSHLEQMGKTYPFPKPMGERCRTLFPASGRGWHPCVLPRMGERGNRGSLGYGLSLARKIRTDRGRICHFGGGKDRQHSRASFGNDLPARSRCYGVGLRRQCESRLESA